MLKEGEVRAIRIGEEAIREWLWETLSHNGRKLFDISQDEDVLFSMKIEESSKEILFYAIGFSVPYKMNDDGIDKYVEKRVTNVSQSLYPSCDEETIYQTIIVPKEIRKG